MPDIHLNLMTVALLVLGVLVLASGKGSTIYSFLQFLGIYKPTDPTYTGTLTAVPIVPTLNNAGTVTPSTVTLDPTVLTKPPVPVNIGNAVFSITMFEESVSRTLEEILTEIRLLRLLNTPADKKPDAPITPQI